jgi:hypothetical protein
MALSQPREAVPRFCRNNGARLRRFRMAGTFIGPGD